MITLPVVGMKSSTTNTKKILSPIVGIKSSNNNDDGDDELEVSGEHIPVPDDYTIPISMQKIKSLGSHGVIHDVKGDGNCGYYAIMMGLCDAKLLSRRMSVTDFRKGLVEYLQANETFFCGNSKILPKMLNVSGTGCTPFCVSRRSNTELTQTAIDKIIRDISRNIYDDESEYQSGTFDRNKWFHTSHAGPIICAKYQVNLLSYDGYGSQNSLRPKYTHMYTRNEFDDMIQYRLLQYWHEPLKHRTIHIAGDGRIHFQYFQPIQKRTSKRKRSK